VNAVFERWSAVLHNLQAKFAACAAAAFLAWTAQTANSAPAPEARTDGARAARDAGVAPTARETSPVVATFDGGRITAADMETAIAHKDSGTRARLAQPGGRKTFLDQLVRYDLLVLEAERRGYGYHPAVIEAGKRAAIERMIEHDLTVDPASISKTDVEQHFEANVEKYRRPHVRRASHIEVASEAEARALIGELRTASRERFARVAGERSHDERTRRQGGELGYFDREGRPGGNRRATAIPAELAQAAFALKRPTAISPRPIARASGNFSVLMLTGEDRGLEPRLHDLEAQVRAEIAERRHAEAQQALVATLREQWKPEVHPERMDAIQLDPAPPRVVEPDGF
jgi:hypothetical protein